MIDLNSAECIVRAAEVCLAAMVAKIAEDPTHPSSPTCNSSPTTHNTSSTPTTGEQHEAATEDATPH